MIILVHINFSEDHSEKILPLGILSVGSALKKNGYEVKLININEKQIDDAVKKIVEMKPDYIGISVMTGVQTAHSADFSKKLKKESNIPILWGGIHPSLLPEQCIKEDYIDYVICGEGEMTILDFTEQFFGDRDFGRVLGLSYKKDGKIFNNSLRPLIENLDEWRLDFSLLDLNQFIFPLDKYKRVIAYKASRGCPFGCGFCYNYQFNQSRWRAWSEETVLEDINFIKDKYRIDAIKFYDDNFFVNRERALSLLKAINLPAHMEIRIDFIDDVLASKLKELKIFDMLIGLESGSERMLQLIDKRFNVERLLQGVRSIAKHNLHATYSFIVGLPTETKADFEATINLMSEVYKIHPRAGFTLGAYLPYPGSKLYEFSLTQGFIPPEKTEDWGKIDRFRKDFESPWIDVKKVWVIRECFKILSWDFALLKKWFEFRIKHKFYLFPIDIYIVEFLAGIAIEEKGFFGKLLRQFYNVLRFRKKHAFGD
ncbi:MAG: radical SAM protein [Candidatus Tagabacteria bacterium]